MSSRRIEDLTPRMRELCAVFDIKMKEAGLPYIITRVACNITEQMALYVQGRLPFEDVNRFRTAAGLVMIMKSENNVVTWTLLSNHVVNPAKPREPSTLSFLKVLSRLGT